WSLRMADFWGGAPSANVSGTPPVTGTGACNAAWILAVNFGVYGYDGNVASGKGVFPLAGCVSDANYVSGSDILVVRYANTDAVPTSGGSSGITPGKIYLQAKTGLRGELFANTVPTDLPNSIEGVSTYPYSLEMYYLRPCSDPGTGGVCSATSDGGSPIPTLMRLRLQDDGTLISEPVVEGVEQLQFDYGIRTSPDDATPSKYVSADQVTDWSQVIAVRVGYVLRAQTRDTALSHPFDSGNSSTTTSPTYATRLSGNCEYGIDQTGARIAGWNCPNYSLAQLGSKPQQFNRAQMTAVVQVRNRIRM
ncbi:MAG: hypothetical protein C4338_07515, partial [Rhodanobacteraceae bacterium]